MKTQKTIAGNNYVVYSKNGGTVTDASGTLNKTVEAGDFLFIPAAPSDMLMCDDDESVIKQANFKRALAELGLLGGGDTSGLPARYRRVEYLEGTGTQLIDTEFWPSADDTINIRLSYVDPSSNSTYIFRVNNTNNQGAVMVYKTGAGASAVLQCYSRPVDNSCPLVAGEVYEAIFMSDGVSINGNVKKGAVSKYEAANPILLFNNATGSGGAPSRVYSFKAARGEVVAVELLPALDPTGAPCMYDLASKQPIYNNGTGDFLYPGKEKTATTYSLRRPRMYAQMTPHGIRRLYHVPKGYNGTPDEYAAENGFKVLVETPAPEEGYWAPVWHDREDCIEIEWVETEPPAEEELLTAE